VSAHAHPLRVDAFVFACLLFGGTESAGAIEFRQLAQCSSPTPYVYCIWGEPALSPDANWLAFTDGTTWPPWYEWWPHLVVSRLDGSGSLSVGIPAHNGWESSPAWSPDGARLAFVAEGWDEKTGLWTVDLRDPEAPGSYTQLVHQLCTSPTWSADGGNIVFVSGEGLWRVSSAGGAAAPLSVQGAFPSCGPGGEIVFARDADLWILEADGRTRRLTDTPSHESTPAWSPAGTWIAFASDRAGNWDIWVIASTGGTPVRVTTGALDESDPSWSSDGAKLAYHAYDGATDSFWLATDLPDFRTSVQVRSWGSVKNLYR
jgi:Tol biopolymer transport system component